MISRVQVTGADVITAGSVAGNGLRNNLIAYWPGNEVAGNLIDAHTNALHLTDTNTVTNAAGLVYPTARLYTAANSELHARAGDDALLSTGDVDFTLASWVYATYTPIGLGIAGKFGAAGSREYCTMYEQGGDRFRFYVSADGTALVNVDANNLGAPADSTWYLVLAWHDSVANTINIQINNGTADSAAHAGGVLDGAQAFRIGRISMSYWDGRIGPTAFWKSAPGGGGVLTAAQKTAYWNGGAGLQYGGLT